MPTKTWLINEYRKICKRMDEIVPKVLCHNDAHNHNIIYDPQQGQY